MLIMVAPSTRRTGSLISSGGGGGGGTADLWDAHFETDLEGIVDWDGVSAASGPFSRTAGAAHAGSFGLEFAIAPRSGNDNWCHADKKFSVGGVDRLWLRYYFKTDVGVSTTAKWMRFYDPTHTTALGGMWMEDDVEACFDNENAAVQTPIGISAGTMTTNTWQCMELDYWRNGAPSGNPSMAFRLNGNAQALPDGTPTHFFGSPPTVTAIWTGGRLDAGSRVGGTTKMGILEMCGTLNDGNNTTGTLCMDDIAISSTGWIGL